MKRKISVFLTLAMLLSMCTFVSYAAELRAGTSPTYNAVTGHYEISTPEQLYYLSGTWKDGTPRDGYYELTADVDMAGYTDFAPISSKKSECFVGTFDGGFHAIRNLKIDYHEKYSGLFGYVGNEDEQAYIKNVALLSCGITGQQNVGGIAGVNYGTITGCVVTGSVTVNDESNSHTGGGIAGKVKEGEGPIIGHVENCFVFADVSAPYDAGGIAGIQDGGGYVGHSYAGGTVKAYAATGTVGHAGGIAGSFNAGEYIVGCVAAQSLIEGKADTDKIVGQLADEAATNITGNLSWEGTALNGNEPLEQTIVWDDVSTETLQSRSTYEKLGWNFDEVWDWDGAKNMPVLRGYGTGIFEEVAPSWTVDSTRIISRAVNTVSRNSTAAVKARVVTPFAVKSVTLHYGFAAEQVDQTVGMTKTGEAYEASIPTNKAGDLFYYIKVQTDTDTVTKPYDKEIPIVLHVDDGSIPGQPTQITITPDTEQGGLRFNWLTDPRVTQTVIAYKQKGAATWQTASGTSYVESVTEGYKEKAAHRVAISGLTPDAEYEYRVGDGKTFMSDESSFLAPQSPDAQAFSIIFCADPQSESVENYMSAKETLNQALKICPNPQLLLSAGDITQNGYKSTEWEACFEVLGDYYAKYPTAVVAGNHEMKGDWSFISFAQRFNMSGGDTGYPEFDRTMGYFEYGDAVFVLLDSEVTPPEKKAEIMEQEMKWAKSVFERSDKKWRVLMTHAGPYTSNHDPLEVRDYYINDSEYSLDAMGVDLLLNGHDHIYIRSTVKNDIKVNTGDGTTCITGGTCGNKFYEYLPERSDYATDFYTDKEDRQVFSILTFSENAIRGTAYQKQDPEDWNSFEPVDSYEIRNTQLAGKKAADYDDLKNNRGLWYYDAAAYVTENKMVGGEQAYVFGGDEYLTRAEIASALYHVAGQPDTALANFSDVPVTHQQRQAIAWVSEQEVMSGVDNNRFAPDALMTRQELAAVLLRFRRWSGSDTAGVSGSTQFTDHAAIADWARQGVTYCVGARLMEGDPDGGFRPRGNVTRAELSVILERLGAASR